MTKRISLGLVLFLALLSSVQAASMSMASIGGGFAKTGSTYSVKGATATAANGAFVTPATVTASGKLVTMPASASFAANAASFAVSSIRLNPALLVAGVVIPWLASEGLQWANNTWTKQTAVSNFYWRQLNGFVAQTATAEAYATLACASIGKTVLNGAYSSGGGGTNNYYSGQCSNTSYYQAVQICAATGAVMTPACSPAAPQNVPATEADFAVVGTHVLPDDVAQQLARADVSIPVNQPVLSPASVPDGEPYLDPLTGRMVQRHIEVRPAPTAENPERVEIIEYVKDAGAVPGQTAAPVAPTKEIVFPSDYARQGEAQAAADSINLKLDKLVEASPAPADLVTPDPGGYTDFGTTFSSLLGWQLPGHTSQCPTASFNTPWNTAYTIDSHCQLITNHWSALQAAMAVVWTIIALFIVLRA